MRAENSMIFKTIMDGQGNYDGIEIKAGDKITLKTPASPEAAQEVLRFKSEESSGTDSLTSRQPR